ncbi:MAG: hypothetical protein AAF502_11620 [Bacteroidota bacterium]
MEYPNPPRQILNIINQVFDLEKKIKKHPDSRSFERNLRRINDQFEELGLSTHNPLGELYQETRTDCEASISGELKDKLIITEVIKPIIIAKDGGFNHIVQKAVVIVESLK